MSLTEALHLKKAFRRLRQDQRDDAWPDVVGHRDYARQLEVNVEHLKDRIGDATSYQASLPLSIDLPKRGFTLRAGTRPRLEDRILYQAVADLLAPHFQAEPCVYSNRLSSNPESPRMFVRGVRLWLQFQDQQAALCREYPHMVETDIAAYFDYINHDLLVRRIDDLFRDRLERAILNDIKVLLKRLWTRWSRSPHRSGIPQVNDPSSFFGNLYLDELDKWMCRRGYVFLRYVDDMCVFVSDEPSARKALADLIVKLREMGLYVVSKKTAVRESDEVLNELGEGRRQIDAIEQGLESGVPDRIEAASRQLESFFDEVVEDADNFNDRHFRYCVNRFKRLAASGLGGDMHSRIIGQVLERLRDMPDATDVFVDYLSMFPEDDRVQASVLDFLEGPYNVYPWQEMHLLELLIRCRISPALLDRTMGLARSIACTSRSHRACAAKALLLWGKNGDYADRREIRSIYYNESSEDVRRTIVVAVQEMQKSERDNFYRSVVGTSHAVNMTAEYIQSLSAPTYHYYNPPPGLELVEFYEDSDDLDDLGSEYFL